MKKPQTETSGMLGEAALMVVELGDLSGDKMRNRCCLFS